MTSLDSSPYTYEAPASAALFDRAQTITPGGVNSPVRAFRAVGGTPRFMVEGSGPWITDADGRRYVDLVSSWGPLLLGHAHPAVVEAVTAAARRGLSFGAPTEGELDLAEEIRDRMAPVERVRLVSSGTEAVMSAVRLARGATGRPRGREVLRPLPRARRRAARLGRLRRRHPRPARHPGRHHGRGRRHRRPPVQRRRRRGGGLRRARQRHRLRHQRGRRRQHGRRPAAGRLQLPPAPDHRGARRAADPRRGHDRLPGLALGLVRHRPRRRRPLHLRQGHGRRAAGRRVRWPGRPHGAARPGRAGLPGRHAVGEPRRGRRRADHAAALHRRGLRALRRGRRGPARRGQRGPVRRRRPAPRPAGRQHVLDLLRARRAPGARLRRRPQPERRAVHRLLPRDAGPRGLPAAVGVRGLVRQRRALRRGARPGARGAPRRRRAAAEVPA